MFIKPKQGLKVRDPISKMHLVDGGEEKPESSYWIRCLRSGDVVIVDRTVLDRIQISDSNVKPSEKR